MFIMAVAMVCSAAVTKSQLVGSWKTTLNEDGANMDMTITYNADGSGSFVLDVATEGVNIGRATFPMTWTLSGNTINYNMKKQGGDFKLSQQFKTMMGLSASDIKEFEAQMAAEMKDTFDMGGEANEVKSVTATKLVIGEEDGSYTLTRVK